MDWKQEMKNTELFNDSWNPTSTFAKTIMDQKYAHPYADGSDEKENWAQIAYRVAYSVTEKLDLEDSIKDRIFKAIRSRKFVPGGRYLYASGRPYHQVQNCVLFRAEDSREGWSDLMHKACMSLMTGAGIGVVYSDVRPRGSVINKTGGFATGPTALMQMLNEAGRHIMQGGSRRSAIWAGLHWNHPDAQEFITIKNWSPEIKAAKERDYNFPAPMDGTNISVILDDAFFEAYINPDHEDHALANNIYWLTVKQMLETAEPGFSIDVGANAGENLRNAPVSADTHVLTAEGYKQVGEIVGTPTKLWTGKRFAEATFRKTKENVPTVRVEMTGGRSVVADPSHEFFVERYHGAGNRRKLIEITKVPASQLEAGDILHVSLPQAVSQPFNKNEYILGYTYGDGSFCKRYEKRAEITFCTDESKRCAEYMLGSELIKSVTPKDNRGFTRMYLVSDLFANRTKSKFPICDRSPSLIAGMFDADGSYDRSQNRVRLSSVHRSFLEDVRRYLEELGIQSGVSTAGISTYGQHQGYNLTVNANSVNLFKAIIPTKRLQIEDHEAYRPASIKVISVEPDLEQDVFCCDVGVPEHSFMADGVIISNCTEITSFDDSDICNLGSINMGRVETLEEMKELVEIGTIFLLAGTMYSDVPTEKISNIRNKNRRLGLGLMGLHEWLLKRGLRYDKNEELEKYMEVYATSTEIAATWADRWKISRPIKTRAIAPTGTIGIVSETTTGIEPIFCVAYKRRYLKGDVVNYQYVIDPTAERLIAEGLDPDTIEDAYSLSEDVERRIAFQAWLQQYVDHSISSTVNLPQWGSEQNNTDKVRSFGDMLMKYIPNLRGITCYPDGSRGGQPLTAVKYSTAMKHLSQVFYESPDVCDITKGGSCGA